MTNTPPLEKRQNKNFVLKNQSILKDYALRNHEAFGQGIIVINLLLLNSQSIKELSFPNSNSSGKLEQTVHQPISYITKSNFWFKMISLKIKQKYQIDIHGEDNSNKKLLIVFIKDPAIENFSIYSIKL